MFKLINSSALLASQNNAFLRLASEMEEQRNRWKLLAQPLSQIRESMLFTNQLSKAIESSALTMGWQEEMRKLASPLSMISPGLRMSDEFSKQMAAISSIHRERFSGFAKPYQELLETLNSNSVYARTIKEIAGQHDWMKGIRLPVLDSATAATIAAVWGHDGVEKQLQSFGINYQQFLKNTESESDLSQDSQQIKLPQIDFWTGFSILLAILMFIYQTSDSAQTENHLFSEIQISRDEANKNTELIGQLLQTLIEERQPQEEGQTQFVVRSRVSTIRKLPRSDSAVIAEIFPNQVVTTLDEDGKWIEIEYFDWIKQEFRTGWVLKKYLIRVPMSSQNSQ